MSGPEPMRGALAPVITPFTEGGAQPDADRLIDHCRWLIEGDVGLAVFGTNSEGTSLSVSEKEDLLDALVGAGLPPARMMPGTGHCAVTDTIRITRKAVGLGCGGVLMLPPFYYPTVSDEGLFRFVSSVIDGVGDDRLRIYLYHIPPMAKVGWSLELIERLIDAYPETVVGLKDSSGDWDHTQELLRRFPGWGTFCGNEHNLLEAMGLGAAGCISATCNVNGAAIARLIRTAEEPEAEALQEWIRVIRRIIEGGAMIPALKSLIARHRADPAWRTLRPPLVELSEEDETALYDALDAVDFEMHVLECA
ncbi:MAG: dihydrodipicolinate synthase family protein [Azospirillaceae bacterium]